MTELERLPDLEFETPVTPARSVGNPGMLKLIPVTKLRIDRSYQRPIDVSGKKNIRRIAENFRWTRFSPLIVSPRPGGVYAVIDGQHRAAAAKLHGGIKELPCLVLKCDARGEADAFSTINGLVTRMQTQYLFRARVAAGDPTASATAKAAAAAGVRLMPYPVTAAQLQVGETLAVRTIELCLAKYGELAVVSALKLIVQTGDGNPGLVRAEIIEAFSDVLYRAPGWLAAFDKVKAAVEAMGIRKLYVQAQQQAVEQGGGTRLQINKIVSALFLERIGEPGDAPKHTITAAATHKKRKGHVPSAFRNSKPVAPDAASRRAILEGAARSNKTAAPSAKQQDGRTERELIEEHLRTKGVRRFESGATGDYWHLLEWLRVECGRTIKRHNTTLGNRKIYEVDGRRYDAPGLVALINSERQKRKLEPITAPEGKAA